MSENFTRDIPTKPLTYRWMSDIIKSGLSPAVKGDLMEYSKTNSRKKTKNMIYLLKKDFKWAECIEKTENKFKSQK